MIMQNASRAWTVWSEDWYHLGWAQVQASLMFGDEVWGDLGLRMNPQVFVNKSVTCKRANWPQESLQTALSFKERGVMVLVAGLHALQECYSNAHAVKAMLLHAMILLLQMRMLTANGVMHQCRVASGTRTAPDGCMPSTNKLVRCAMHHTTR